MVFVEVKRVTTRLEGFQAAAAVLSVPDDVVLPESVLEPDFSETGAVAGADVPPLPLRKSVTYQPVPFS
jgi:hypothetical protein